MWYWICWIIRRKRFGSWIVVWDDEYLDEKNKGVVWIENWTILPIISNKEDNMKVGDSAPDFKLKDQNKKEWKLSDLKGKKVLLSFHPLAWTNVCGQQMQSLERNQTEFEKLNTVTLGLSIDTVPSKHEWAKSLGIEKTSLLSDFWLHGDFASKLGIFRQDDGFSERANIIVDEHGKIVFFKVYPIAQLPDIDEILKELKG